MPGIETVRNVGEAAAVVTAVRCRSESEFAALVEPHRRELRVHCYRMLGSLDEAEDMVQETFVKAWRSRAGFEGRSTLRAWLYRIATNACLDEIKGRRRRVTGFSGGEPGRRPSFDDVPWLQPIPDALLGCPHPAKMNQKRGRGEGDDRAGVPRRRPASAAAAAGSVDPGDVLGWSASETAEALGSTVAAMNSALQRARARLQDLGQDGRPELPVTPPSDEERRLLQRYIDAHARADAAAVIELLGDDVSFSMPTVVDQVVQEQARFDGRQAVAAFFHELLGAENPGGGVSCRHARTGSRPPPTTCVATVTTRTGRSRSTCSRSKTVPWSRSRRSTPRCSRRSGFRRPCDARIRLCATAVAAHPTVLLRLRAVGHRPARGRNAPGRAGRVAGALIEVVQGEVAWSSPTVTAVASLVGTSSGSRGCRPRCTTRAATSRSSWRCGAAMRRLDELLRRCRLNGHEHDREREDRRPTHSSASASAPAVPRHDAPGNDPVGAGGEVVHG